VVRGEQRLKSYERLKTPGQFSEELLEKLLRGVSAQKYEETVFDAAQAFGVSPSAISQKMVTLTAQKLQAFQERSLVAFRPFAIFLDTIHRGGEAFLVALGVDVSGQKMALGFWQGSSENHEIGGALFADLERRGLVLSKRILFVTDGGRGLLKALRERFGKKLVHQRCALHKSRNVQRHLAKRYRKEAHRKLMAALEQTSYADAKQMLRELEKWLRTKNESAADSLLEAFEELLTLHRLKVPALLRKTLMSTNPIESMFSLVRHSERNIKRTRGSAMLQRWLGTVLLYCEKQFKRVKGFAGIAQVMATIEAEQTEQQTPSTTKAA
jgi:transposase-like protein